jgi:hypothetical protein
MRTTLKYNHVIIVILLIISLLFIIQPLFESFLISERNQNEGEQGWNAGHAARATGGLNIYDTFALFITVA